MDTASLTPCGKSSAGAAERARAARFAMIRSLHIKDYLLVSDISIEFDDGLTVITGETGAGKSLIVDSLVLATGGRADSKVVRHGCVKAEIVAVFDTLDERARHWLAEQELEDEQQCVLRRIVYRDRPSRAFINGIPVSMQNLGAIGSFLVDIHGQHDHQLLLRQSEQRRILDSIAGHRDAAAELESVAKSIRRLESQRSKSAEKLRHLKERRELLAHQIGILEELQPDHGEFASLEEELAALSGAEMLAKSLHGIAHRLHYADESTVSAEILSCQKELALAGIHSNMRLYATMLEEARLRIDDAARELHSIAERTEHNPQKIATVNERMSALQEQARIHHANPDHLDEVLAQLSAELASTESDLFDVEAADANIESLKSQHRAIAARLTAGRKAAAAALAADVTGFMQRLGMQRGSFDVALEPEPNESFSWFGHENVKFLAATNPGAELGELARVASGGELSRLSLAIQVNASDMADVASIVFDEIDIGIGGSVAESVGKLLKRLGGAVQVFCITHLPQVASCGDQQLNVIKSGRDASRIEVRMLNHEERISELARMLGGAKITAQATEHAKQMLSSSPQ